MTLIERIHADKKNLRKSVVSAQISVLFFMADRAQSGMDTEL
jgi:hypothetical protein